MMKSVAFIACLFFSTGCFAQDTMLSNRALAEKQIVQLHSGTLVVRLKTYSKSVAAYRQSGKGKLADKLERNYRIINLFLMKAFLENYNFSQLLFIKAEDSRKLVAQQPNIFLNQKLEVDSSVQPPKGPYFIAEFGELMSNDRTNDKSFVVRHTEATSSSGSSSAIVISDTTFTQLKEPMPFYALVSLVDETGPAIAPGANGAPVDTAAWQMENTSAVAKARVNPIWKKDIYGKTIKRLDHRLIEYYCKVSSKAGKSASADFTEWERKNPNKDADARLKVVIDEITKLQDDNFHSH